MRVAPRPGEAKLLRFNACMNLMLPVILGLDLVFQIGLLHPDPKLAMLRSLFTAGAFFLIQANFVTAGFMWQRSKLATSLGSSVSPA